MTEASTRAAPMADGHTDVSAGHVVDTHETVIQAGQSSRDYWRDIWRQRELLYFLSWRDLLVRYKQTVVGTAWVLIRPLLTLIIFTVLFGRWARMPSGGAPYPLLVFAGMLPWFYFSTTVSDCSGSVLNNSALVGKVYFPRLIAPLSALVVCTVDYLVSCALIVVVVIWTGTPPSVNILVLPLLTVWTAALGFGFGVWVAALNVRYRDLRHLVPFLLQLGIYISPVGYSATIVPPHYRLLYSVNPLVGIIDGFRWAILGGRFDAYAPGIAISVGLTILLLVTGIAHFRRVEKSFVDYL